MATFLHPILSASHLCSWNSRWENTIDRKLYEYKPIWPDLFQWTRHFLQENLWYFPLASHRCVWHLSCDHLGLFFPLGKKHTSLPCLSCKLIHTMYFGAVFGWFNICSFFPSALSLNLQKKIWYIVKNRGGYLFLDAPDDQYCAHNPLPTTFCQSNIFGVQVYVIARYLIKSMSF